MKKIKVFKQIILYSLKKILIKSFLIQKIHIQINVIKIILSYNL